MSRFKKRRLGIYIQTPISQEEYDALVKAINSVLEIRILPEYIKILDLNVD